MDVGSSLRITVRKGMRGGETSVCVCVFLVCTKCRCTVRNVNLDITRCGAMQCGMCFSNFKNVEKRR